MGLSKRTNKTRAKVVRSIITVMLISLLIVENVSFASVLAYSLSYDANGNMVQDDKNYYEYNSRNQIAKIRAGNSIGKIIAEYFYGPDSERIKKIIYTGSGNETTYYVSDDFVRKVNSSGTFDEVYYYDEAVLVASDKNGKRYYYHPDNLGSTDIVTSENGSVVEEMGYLPFGAAVSNISGSERYTFTGQEADAEAGLMYYHARYYSPGLMRFIQPDTVLQDIYDPQSLNKYAYARNNPLKYTDETGNIFDTLFDVGMIVWDFYDIIRDPLSIINWGAFGLDVAAAFVPFLPAMGGRALKGLAKGARFIDHAADAGRAAGKAIDAGRAIDKAIDAGKNIKKAKDVSKAFSAGKKSNKIADINKLKQYEKTLKESGEITVNSFPEADALRRFSFPDTKKVAGAGPSMTRSSEGLFKGDNLYKNDYLFDKETNTINTIYWHNPKGAHADKPHINIRSGKNKFTIIIDKTKEIT